MKALKCDRCGILYETYSGMAKSFYITTNPFMSHGTLDLCPECNKELKDWFTEKGSKIFSRRTKQMPWKEKPSKRNRKNDILVIRAPFCMKAEAMERTYKMLIQQMRSGLVLLPPGFSVEFCPPDVEVKLMDSSNDILEEG